MKTFTLTLAFFVLNCIACYGQKYYTLRDGSWNNTTNVWSLNGVTPCGCYPGNSLVTDSIFVSHQINFTANISASSLSKVQINTGGVLSSSNFRLAVNNSIVVSDGLVNVKEINIGSNGNFILNNSSMIIGSRVLNSGYFEINASEVILMTGNFENYSSGVVVINGNSHVQLHNGNYRNQGSTSICDSCCLVFQAGNINNESTGTFSGDGNIISEIGNISNLGSWSTSIAYCTSGTDTGMPTPQNCTKANEICKVIPLPSEIIYFTGYPDGEKNVLKWESASEENLAYYRIDKSEDGKEWTSIGVVNAAGNSNTNLDYTFEDNQKVRGTIYYKLTQIDDDGKNNNSEIVSIVHLANEMLVYPNPSSENATVELQKDHPYSTLTIHDSYGRILNNIELDNTLLIEIQLPENDGLYFITVEGESEQKTMTLVKI